MEIGVSTASLFGRFYNEDALAVLNEIDSRVTEIFLGTFSEYTEEYARLLKSRLDGLTVHSVHTLNTHFEPMLFSQNPRAYADALKIFTDVVKSAEIIGATHYTFHGLAKIKKNAAFNNFELYGERFDTLCKIAAEHGVSLTLENVEWAMYGKVGFFKEVSGLCPSLKACLDVKQADRSGCDYREYIREMGKKLETVHLSDVGVDGRIALPGCGKFDFRELFGLLKGVGFCGNMLIEVYKENFTETKELAESLRYLRNIKKEVFNDETL